MLQRKAEWIRMYFIMEFFLNFNLWKEENHIFLDIDYVILLNSISKYLLETVMTLLALQKYKMPKGRVELDLDSMLLLLVILVLPKNGTSYFMTLILPIHIHTLHTKNYLQDSWSWSRPRLLYFFMDFYKILTCFLIVG
jgi:hypothetical protein